MGIKETIESILTQLNTITVTNGDGGSVAPFVAVWNNQTEKRLAGTYFDYTTPATFVQIALSEGIPMGMGVTGYEMEATIMLEHFYLNADTTLDQNLIIFDLRDKVHRVLNGFVPTNCTPLYDSGDVHDHQHNNTYLMAMVYKCFFTDATATQYDPAMGYSYATLTNPVLNINETIYIGAIPPSGGGSSTTLLGSVINGSGVTVHQWWTGSGVPDDSLGSNGDYYRDEDNGDVYYKSGGVYALVGNILGGGGGSSAPMFTNVTLSNDMFPLTAVKGKCYILEDGVLASDSTIDVSNLTNEGDEFMFLNRDRNRNIAFLGATVYYADERVADGLLWQSNVWVRMANGKLRVILG